MNNPACYWNDCNGDTLISVPELLKHVDYEHAFQEDQSAAAPNDKNI